jgi:predicted helicase
MYRPFSRQYLYFGPLLNQGGTLFFGIFTTPESERENRVICLSGVGSNKPFHCLMINLIPCLDMLEKTQCFPLYTYNEQNQREDNISDAALEKFQIHYRDKKIDKISLFHFIYGILQTPEYGKKYAANLRLALPRIPLISDFWKFAEAGKKLAHLHVNYELQDEYALQMLENKDKALDWRVKKMHLSKDKTTLVYNDFLTLQGIPAKALEYKLGNRSALEWIVEQYQVTIDPRTNIANDPNRDDDPQYIVKLLGKIITVSLKTLEIREGLMW